MSEFETSHVSMGDNAVLLSEPCSYEQLASSAFRGWADQLDEDFRAHRKLWEWCWIGAQAEKAGVLHPGKTALGFAVGMEPLVGVFANKGVAVTATDLPADHKDAKSWVETSQHAQSLDDHFGPSVSTRHVDMREVPDDLTGFDLAWSSCAIEHLGSIGATREFLLRQMDCLKPGGIALHTTEFNISSRWRTWDSGPTVLLRKKDIIAIARDMHEKGHEIHLDFGFGKTKEDLSVDKVPYTHDPHIRVKLGSFVSTSYGLAIRKH